LPSELSKQQTSQHSPVGDGAAVGVASGRNRSGVDEPAAVIELRAVLVCDVPDVALRVAEAKPATEARSARFGVEIDDVVETAEALVRIHD
jgi:hypothetical protein